MKDWQKYCPHCNAEHHPGVKYPPRGEVVTPPPLQAVPRDRAAIVAIGCIAIFACIGYLLAAASRPSGTTSALQPEQSNPIPEHPVANNQANETQHSASAGENIALHKSASIDYDSLYVGDATSEQVSLNKAAELAAQINDCGSIGSGSWLPVDLRPPDTGSTNEFYITCQSKKNPSSYFNVSLRKSDIAGDRAVAVARTMSLCREAIFAKLDSPEGAHLNTIWTFGEKTSLEVAAQGGEIVAGRAGAKRFMAYCKLASKDRVEVLPITYN